MARLPSSGRWPRPSNGGTRGRQVTQVERARPEAEERRKGRERGRGEVEARQLRPAQADSGEGQKVSSKHGGRHQQDREAPEHPPAPRQDVASGPPKKRTDILARHRAPGAQIGRASCREREEISVDAVSVEKK